MYYCNDITHNTCNDTKIIQLKIGQHCAYKYNNWLATLCIVFGINSSILNVLILPMTLSTCMQADVILRVSTRSFSVGGALWVTGLVQANIVGTLFSFLPPSKCALQTLECSLIWTLALLMFTSHLIRRFSLCSGKWWIANQVF